MAVTNEPISNTARFGNRPDARVQTVTESNGEPQEYVSVAEYLRGIQKRNIIVLNLLGQLLNSVTGAGPEPYEPEKSDNMTDHVRHIFNEACDIEEQLSCLAYYLGINT